MPGTAPAVETPTSLPAAHADGNASTVGGQYPQLASAGLVHAKLAELRGGVLLRAGDVVIAQKDIDAEVTKAPAELREQLRKNAFFLLEQLATRKLLLQEARQAGGNLAGDERALLQSYFQTLVKGAQVSDREIAEFYEKNRDLVGQATLEQAKEQIRQYLLQQKQQQIVDRHIQTLARRTPVAVSAGWVKTQAELAKDNPVDKARTSGKPTFANFGAKGCVPCDMMEPVREALRKKYEGRLNVVFVHVRNDQILASRYGVQGIPLLVFFDAKGNEVFRHTGYFPQERIEQKLAELGFK